MLLYRRFVATTAAAHVVKPRPETGKNLDLDGWMDWCGRELLLCRVVCVRLEFLPRFFIHLIAAIKSWRTSVSHDGQPDNATTD